PLSTTPSQSSSSPSQVSAGGCWFWLQATGPLVHAVVPAVQRPRWRVWDDTSPPGFPLSIWPSQSLSRPSQVSAGGSWFWLQAMEPLVHAVVPAAQTPRLPVLHAALPPGFPLSTTPSQSLSSPSHVSAVGCWFWLQTTVPLVHEVVP